MSYLKTKDVAKYLNITGQTVRALVEKGDLAGVRVGGQLRIEEGALKSYIESQTSIGKDGCRAAATTGQDGWRQQ